MKAANRCLDEARLAEAARLWTEYAKSKSALLKSVFIRSFRAAEADFAEWLVAVTLDGELAKIKSQRGYDLTAGEKRVQVKSMAKMPGNPNGYIIGNRDRTNDWRTGATHYAFVFFEELIPDAIFLIDEAFVRQFERKQIKRPDLERASCEIDMDLEVFKRRYIEQKD